MRTNTDNQIYSVLPNNTLSLLPHSVVRAFGHGAMGRRIHDWSNKSCGMCYPVCGIVHIKEPLLLIGKSSPYLGSGFTSRYLNGPMPCNRK